MAKRGRTLITILLCGTLLLLTGCWDSIPVENRAIVLALGIDYLPEPPHIEVILVYPLVEDTRKRPSNVHVIRGKSVSEALATWHHAEESFLSLAMTTVVIIGEEAARQGVVSHIHDLYSFPDLRTAAQVIVAGGSARELLTIVPPESQRIALHLQGTIERGLFQRDLPRSTLADFVMDAVTPGIDPLTGLFGSIGTLTPTERDTGSEGGGGQDAQQQQGSASSGNTTSEEKEDVQILGASLWILDQMAGSITLQELQHLLIAGGEAGRMQSIVLLQGDEHFTDGNDQVGVLFERASARWVVSMVNDKPHYDLHLDIRLSLSAYQGKTDITESDNLRELEKTLSAAFEQNVTRTLQYVSSQRSDPLGLGQRFRVQFPKLWNPEGWREQLAEATFAVQAQVQMKNIGIHIKRLEPK